MIDLTGSDPTSAGRSLTHASEPLVSAVSMELLAAATGGRIVGAVVVLLVGLATLVFNRRWTAALVKGQREVIGTLLGTARSASDRLFDHPALLIAPRLHGRPFFFVAVGVGMIGTAGG